MNYRPVVALSATMSLSLTALAAAGPSPAPWPTVSQTTLDSAYAIAIGVPAARHSGQPAACPRDFSFAASVVITNPYLPNGTLTGQPQLGSDPPFRIDFVSYEWKTTVQETVPAPHEVVSFDTGAVTDTAYKIGEAKSVSKTFTLPQSTSPSFAVVHGVETLTVRIGSSPTSTVKSATASFPFLICSGKTFGSGASRM